jgi:hypothetical protein
VARPLGNRVETTDGGWRQRRSFGSFDDDALGSHAVAGRLLHPSGGQRPRSTRRGSGALCRARAHPGRPGASSDAVLQGQSSQSRSMSSWSNGAIGLRPKRRSRKYSSSTQARCLSRPPSITDDTPSRRRSPSVHFSTLPREGTPVAFQPCHGRRYLVAAHEALDVPLWRLSGREAQGARHDGPPQALSERGTYRTPIRYSADPLRPRDLFHPSASGCRQTPWGYLVRGVARRPSR